MRLALILSIGLLAACSSPGGPYPSLQPRAAEAIDPRLPVVRPMNDRPVTAALAAQLQDIVGRAHSGADAFATAAAQAERLTAAAGAAHSEGWIAAEQALSAAVAARRPVALALGDSTRSRRTRCRPMAGLRPTILRPSSRRRRDRRHRSKRSRADQGDAAAAGQLGQSGRARLRPVRGVHDMDDRRIHVGTEPLVDIIHVLAPFHAKPLHQPLAADIRRDRRCDHPRRFETPEGKVEAGDRRLLGDALAPRFGAQPPADFMQTSQFTRTGRVDALDSAKSEDVPVCAIFDDPECMAVIALEGDDAAVGQAPFFRKSARPRDAASLQPGSSPRKRPSRRPRPTRAGETARSRRRPQPLSRATPRTTASTASSTCARWVRKDKIAQRSQGAPSIRVPLRNTRPSSCTWRSRRSLKSSTSPLRRDSGRRRRKGRASGPASKPSQLAKGGRGNSGRARSSPTGRRGRRRCRRAAAAATGAARGNGG